MRVATNAMSYSVVRNIALDTDAFDVEQRWDLFRVLKAANRRIPGYRPQANWVLKTLFCDGLRSDIVHLWNGIHLGVGPWVTTFEETLPFWRDVPPRVKRLVWKRLAHGSCKRLIAISEHARKTLAADLEEAPEDVRKVVLSKTSVLHPPQRLLVGSLGEKDAPADRVRFTLVGTDFYRKGGAALVRAFDRLLSEGLPVELHLVTRLTQKPGSKTTPEMHERVQRILDAHEHIVCHGKQPYKEVLSLLRASHVGLLPTHQETFGYSVLEAQAAGCPVITTNICALPEINSNETGWVIDLPLQETRYPTREYPFGDGPVSTQIEEGVYEAAREAVEHPERLRAKGEAALDRIRERHDPGEAAAWLRGVYEVGLAG